MDNQNIIYTYKQTLFSLKIEGNTITWYESNNPVTKRQILYGSTKLSKIQLTPKQHRFELCRSTYTRISFTKYALQNYMICDLWVQNRLYRGLTAELYADFQLHRVGAPNLRVVQESTVVKFIETK